MLIIGNGRMITRDPENPFLKDGAVAIEDGVIKRILTTAEMRKEYPQAEYIDARGGVIMPAFINTHEHIYSSFARGLAIDGYDPHGFFGDS
jgi:cytosine/adenosine deaminase-related metal-dependent hydrolase